MCQPTIHTPHRLPLFFSPIVLTPQPLPASPERLYCVDDSAYLFKGFRLFHVLMTYHDPELALYLQVCMSSSMSSSMSSRMSNRVVCRVVVLNDPLSLWLSLYLALNHPPSLAPCHHFNASCFPKDSSFPPELYAPQWFLTSYSRALPLPLVMRLWDMLIAVDDPAFGFFVGLCLVLRHRCDRVYISHSLLFCVLPISYFMASLFCDSLHYFS